MAEYWERAVYLYQHGSLYPDSWRMPGLPVLLAAAFAVGGGPQLESAYCLNVVVGATSAALTYWLAGRTCPRPWAFAAAVVVATYPTLVLYSTLVATETVVAAPLLGTLVAASYSSRRAALLAGVLCGLSTLVRPASVALLPAAFATATIAPPPGNSGNSRLARAALCAAGFSLSLLPWWWHNAALCRQFLPLDTTGGINLLIGSGPRATGRWDWSNVARIQTEDLRGVDVTSPDGSRRATEMAVSHAVAHPMRWLSIAPAKLSGLLAAEGRETGYLYSIGYFGERAPLNVTAWGIGIIMSFPLLIAAAFAGLATRLGVERRVLVPAVTYLLCATGLHLVSFGDPRFHLPFVPILAVLATGLHRRPIAFDPRWAVPLGIVCVLMLPPWYAQSLNYVNFLRLLAAPGGWRSPVSFDDLL